MDVGVGVLARPSTRDEGFDLAVSNGQTGQTLSSERRSDAHALPKGYCSDKYPIGRVIGLEGISTKVRRVTPWLRLCRLSTSCPTLHARGVRCG